MKQNINKRKFIELCDLLENGVITTKQFCVLIDKKDTNEQSTIIKILKLLNADDRENFFDSIINKEISELLYNVLKSYPIYRKDKIRQDFILENQDNELLLEIAGILRNNFIWNNKELVQIILDKSKENLEYFKKCQRTNIYKTLDNFIFTNEGIFRNQENVELLKRILTLDSQDACKVFLSYLKIDSIANEPLWFDYLLEYYNNEKQLNDYSVYFFQDLEEAECMEKLTEKLKKIDKLDNKKEAFNRFLENILTTNIPLDMDDKEKEKFQNDFDILLSYATEDTDDFHCIKEILEITKEKSLGDEKIKEMYNNMRKCQYKNVRYLISYLYRIGQDEFLDEKTLSQISNMSWDDAKSVLLKRAIELNATSYIEKDKEYYEESFSNSFINYISTGNLTKEELLEIRDKVKNSDSTFNGKTFIVNTKDYVVEETNEAKIVEEASPVTNEPCIAIIKQKEKTLGPLANIRNIFGSYN